MRFKGVVTKKGKNRGDVIEYSPKEKVQVGLGLALASCEELQDYLVHPVRVDIQDLDSSVKGEPLKKMWQNNTYQAAGVVEVSRRHKEQDRILSPKKYFFSIKIEDCLCANGLPDLKTSELNLQLV